MRIEIEPDFRLFVDIDGAGLVPQGPAMVERPTVLLLHGGPGLDHSVYKGDDAMVLDDVAQVVFYDHRGNGRSDRGEAGQWTLDTWADDVVRLCDALGIERPVVIGASFGGFVAQRYLARHPHHPSKVVLACTSARLDPEVTAKSFTRLGNEIAGATARQFFGGDISVMPAFLEHCLPLYATEPLDPDAMLRAVMNPDLMIHFFAGEAKDYGHPRRAGRGHVSSARARRRTRPRHASRDGARGRRRAAGRAHELRGTTRSEPPRSWRSSS